MRNIVRTQTEEPVRRHDISRHDIGGCDHLVDHLYIRQVPPRWAVPQQNAGGVNDRQPGGKLPVDVHETVGQTEMDLSAVPPHHPHHVFQGQGDARQRVMLGHGDIDDPVGLEGVPVQVPLMEGEGAGNVGPLEFTVLHVVDAQGIARVMFFGKLLHRLLDAAVYVTAPRFVAGAVENAHFLGARDQDRDHPLDHPRGLERHLAQV